MKCLYILRHAKSSWATPGLGDKERTLNSRGREQTISLSKWFKQKQIQPEIVLSSSSERTRETFSLIETGLDHPPVTYMDSLYNGRMDDYLSALWEQAADKIMIVGHNPICDELTRYLTASDSPAADKLMAHHFGTGNLATLEFEGKSWIDLGAGSCQLKSFLRSKDIKDL